MKEIFCRLAAYNHWANQKLVHALLEMNEEVWTRETASGFGSLYKTIMHLWDAESIWWQRMRLHQQVIVPSASFQPTMKDACNGLIQQSQHWEDFVRNVLDDASLNSKLIYRNKSGAEFQQPVYDVLLHVFNHSTHHRSQLINMLRQLGAASVPQTDYILYSRSLS